MRPATDPEEQTTQLIGYLPDTLNGLDHSQIHLVPTEHVQAIIAGAVSFVAKVHKMPDLTDIRDTLNIIQLEALDLQPKSFLLSYTRYILMDLGPGVGL